ncbi:MAG TPA: NAD/NADP octopine/nopaline dehydrogenase family protein [Candidatus Hydrogenedentes bacterium]|nr:NAD/NADP octopine/nopaline dehydrogenase family protein [Candidatus Hydrogenedentota bacterium]HOL78171.1 NAD/NADP octopine/nopaline dehydrogenase family protein [Candidatus Hydrogenedentota bacterium]HPO86673.1 NAD/NADP octopine/nopaline dehydrogenase family protein [Candidatus Hydrogenedentota bacterium]
MRLTDILFPGGVLTRLTAADRSGAVAALLYALARYKSIDVEKAMHDVESREEKGTTLIPVGEHHIAIPHASTTACKQLMMAIGISREGIPWDATGRKANLIVLFLAPPELQTAYLRALSRIARLFHGKSFLRDVLHVATPEELLRLFRAAETPLGDLSGGTQDMPEFCVIGAQSSGLALAGHLALTGYKVTLCDVTPELITPIQARGGLYLRGEIDGLATLSTITCTPAEALENADIVFLTVPRQLSREMAERVAPDIKDGQIVVLQDAGIFGAWEVARTFKTVNPTARPYLVEMQTSLFAAHRLDPAQVYISQVRNFVPFATLPSYHVSDVAPVLRKALPQIVPTENVLQLELENVGGLLRPAMFLLNLIQLENSTDVLKALSDDVTPALTRILEKVDQERCSVAAALGLRLCPAKEWLQPWCDTPPDSLRGMMQAITRSWVIPNSPNPSHRCIAEDVAHVLVPLASVGATLGIATPMINALIEIASTVYAQQYDVDGRTAEKLGIKDMNPQELLSLVNGSDSLNEPATNGEKDSNLPPSSSSPKKQ